MSRLRPTYITAARPSRRDGIARRRLLIVLAVVLLVPVLAWSWLSKSLWSSEEDERPLLYHVVRGEYINDITERGNVESASNTEIVSHVESNNSSGTTILSIVEEGYMITQDDVDQGKVLVELDSASLTNQKLLQEIVVENSQATVIQAQNAVDTAEIDFKEYRDGTLKQEREKFNIAIQEAEEELSRLEDYLTYSERLNAKGYVSDLELEGDRSAVRKAKNKLNLAKLDLETLENFTKDKTLKQLESDIQTAKAKLAAEQASHQLDVEKLDHINEQIDHCTIRATHTGQVVYANEAGHRGQGEIVIEEGTMIRERQVIIRLPDPTKMQVKARVSEAKISQVEIGMETTIRLDAYPDAPLKGVVTDVSEYPASSGWFGPAVKEYETLVKILEPPADLRPGYTAEVKIRVEQLENVLQVPVQSIIESGNKLFVVFYENGNFRAREVTVNSSNDKFVVISAGLHDGDDIVLDANAYRDKLDLPEAGEDKQAGRGSPGSIQGEDSRNESIPGAGESPKKPKGPPSVADIFKRLDKDGNGKLDRNEVAQLPGPMQTGLMAADTDKDGLIDRGELGSAMAKLRAAGQSGGRKPGIQP